MRRRWRSPLKTVRQHMGGRPVADGRLAGPRPQEGVQIGSLSWQRWVTSQEDGYMRDTKSISVVHLSRHSLTVQSNFPLTH